MRERVAAVAVVVPFVVGTLSAAADEGDVAFRFRDAAIVESSGLVVLDGLFVTTNDSGDTGRVFAVDGASGRTVGVTGWSDDAEDVEALAPAGPGAVWVGDIGDNAGSRESVTVTRVPVSRTVQQAAGETYELVFPDGPVDAETLLAEPGSGRLLVASKAVLGGMLYAAPARLSATRPNVLRPVGDIASLATDGAFFPDGRHLVLRDYGRAVVYRYPSLERVAELDLPDQQQGEGIAVAGDGRVFVSSEGRHAPVLEVALPAAVREAVRAGGGGSSAGSASGSASGSPSAAPTPAGSREGRELPEEEPRGREPWQWLLGTLLLVGTVAVVVRAVRPR
jgi:hypothetical protein